jgi:ribosomal protein S2
LRNSLHIPPEQTTGGYGSKVTKLYQPHKLLSNPPRPSDVTLELLLASQAHLGHSTSLWNPANSRYIFGVRQGIHIISLDATAAHLRRAAKVVSGVSERGGLILFVGTRPGFDRCVVRAAELAHGCHLFERWTPGTLTNGQQILGKCRLKVVDEFDRNVSGFEEQLLDRPVLKPDLVVCLNPLECKVMLHECALANIPTIGVIDTDANPTWVTYPIPANDDSLRCVQVIAGVLGRAGEEGMQKRIAAAHMGKTTYPPTDDLVLFEGWEEMLADDPVEEEDPAKSVQPSITPEELQQLAATPVQRDEIEIPTQVKPEEVAAEADRSMASAISYATPPETTEAAAPAQSMTPITDEEYSEMITKLTDDELQALEMGTMTTDGFTRLAEKLSAAELGALQEDYAPSDELGEEGEPAVDMSSRMGHNTQTGDNAISQELVQEGRTEGRGEAPVGNRVTREREEQRFEEDAVEEGRGNSRR